MNSRTKNKFTIACISVGALLLLTIAGLYLGRNSLLRMMVDKKTSAAGKEYGLSIKYHSLEMEGVNRIKLEGLSVVPQRRDTILNLQSLAMKFSFWKLLTGDLQVQDIRMDLLNVQLVKRDSIANYDFLFRKNKNENLSEKKESNYARQADELLELIFNFLPENGEVHRLNIMLRRDSNFVAVNVPSLIIKDNRFCSNVNVNENNIVQRWITRGELNHSHHVLQAELYSGERKKVQLPYLERRLGAEIAFDTLAYSLSKERMGSSKIALSGKAEICGLSLYHPALSPEVINLNRGRLAYHISIGSNYVEMDSTSIVQFNKLQFHPYLRAQKENEKWHVTASVNKPWFPADELFGSLPKGLFSNLEGIQTSGSLAYHFLLDVDFARLDSLKLESELRHKDFRIVKYGATNLSKMSGEFMYTAYENGVPVRTFATGPSYEHFTPLDSISPLLQMSVLQSEDGAFFYHRGFLPDAMREALIYDLKVKRFARGGSTITMQLVKNVFLNRRKNIARKLEEALIVWLIETQELTSKHRMYEVYLNIAEWGPLIYGIQEAAAYYFDKRPSQLSAEESIFLASIIPKPKHFRSSFTADMKLKDYLGGYYRLIAARLKAKGLLSEAEADSIRPEITITGSALNALSADKDSVVSIPPAE
ncbi:biosynthetic peptidoglycan transglycosylase [uncultured Bacteroides sp.]|uniref:biosynthetic peptidoglycan transglycosylase n=1 Tax=uncultured Bacteroides sp. TaxID=162156 RepID=UPI002AA8F1E4|nr:biosynthetic peptidoglycan transglycosylase [uncultured Bacteroides sp.]